MDFLAAVASYPNPDDKIRSTSFEVLYFLFIVFFDLTLFFFFFYVEKSDYSGITGSRRW